MQTDRKEKLWDKKGLEGIKQKGHERVKGEKKNKKRKTCESAHRICDHQDLKLYPVAETCHLSASTKYLGSLLSDCISCSLRKLVHPEGDSLVLLSLGRNSSPVSDPCQYHSKWRNCWEDFVGFSEILKNCKQTLLHTKKASCKAGSWTWRSIQITDTYCNLNLMSSIAAHRMALFGICFLTFIFNTQPDTDVYIQIIRIFGL